MPCSAQYRIRGNPDVAFLDQDDGVNVVCRQPVLAQHSQAFLGLQGTETESGLRIPVDQEVDAGVAEVAHPVKEDDGWRVRQERDRMCGIGAGSGGSSMAGTGFGSDEWVHCTPASVKNRSFPAAIVLKKQHDIGKLEALRVTRTARHAP